MDEQRVADYVIIAGLGKDAAPLKITDESEAFVRRDIKDPITDLAVIDRTLDEPIPDGYTCIESTPTGFIADLNFGSFRCHSLFLCYRRGRDKPPLVHIGVHFEGRDKLTANCEKITETPFGNNANVNNGSNSQTYIIFKRANPDYLSPNDLVVTDVCVVIKDEKAPHTFWKIVDRNLNNALLGSDVFLCYKKAVVNRNFLMYQPSLLFRYPVEDLASIPLPSDVSLFSMPMGASLEAWPKDTTSPRPVFAKFVLTVSGNHNQVYNSETKSVQKLYGAALSFYEPYSQDLLSEAQLSSLLKDIPSDAFPNYTFHSNKSICVLSRWPFFDAFQSFLQHILQMAFASTPHSVPVERVIHHLLHAVPFPSVSRPKVLIQLPNSPLSIPLTRPDDSPIPSNGGSFSVMLKNLSPENCAHVLMLALLEQKICLHSLRPDVLTAVAESVTSMIFPFVWQCPYVPLCPLGLCGLLNAPVPFIVGVNSRYFDLYEPPPDVIYVDLDTQSIEIPVDRKDLTLKNLPKKATKFLMEKIMKINSRMAEDTTKQQLEKKQVKVDPEVTGEREFRVRFRTKQFDTEIQEAFLHFMVSVMKGYRSYLKPMVGAPTIGATDPAALFDLDGFLKSRDRTYLKFFDSFIRTQQFIRFIEERSIMSDREASYGMAFFDHCVDRVEKEGYSETRLIEADDAQGDHTVFLPPPEPSKNGEKYIYGRVFPTLQLELFDGNTSKPNDTVSDADTVRMSIPAEDLVNLRTKQEMRTTQNAAQIVHQKPKQWARYLLSTGYALWFMQLPSYVAASNSPSRALRGAFETLQRVLAARLQPPDEVCYRILIQLCGQYSQPALAVNVLFEMKCHSIQPDAVTYGYYNKVVFESHWPSVLDSPYMRWVKVQNVIRGVYLFKQAGKLRRERISREGERSKAEKKVDEVDGLHNLNVVIENDGKRNTGGSSDTGFFSLEQDDKRNSVNSLTSGEFLAVMAELKPGVVDLPSWPGLLEHGTDASSNKLIKAVSQTTDEIVRKSSKHSTISSHSTEKLKRRNISLSPGKEIEEGVFEEVNGNGKVEMSPPHRRHRSLTGEGLSPRRSPRHRKRLFSSGDTVLLTSFPRRRRPGETSQNARKSKAEEKLVTTISASTLPSALSPERVSTPLVMNVNGTVEVLDEYVKTRELPVDEEEEEMKKEEVRKVETAPKRRMKSMSVPRESLGEEAEREDINVPHSTSSDFTTTASNALPKIGAFLRNSKSYSSIKKLWSADKAGKGGAVSARGDGRLAETPEEVKGSQRSINSVQLNASQSDASPLAKSGAALMSGMKSVSSALSRKFEEMAATLTTASPGSYTPSRAGSSLRDIPGALNFGDYHLDLDYDEGREWVNEDMEETGYGGESAVDGVRERGFAFPAYSWSPKGQKGGQHVLVHVDMVSMVVCHSCGTNIYDEEVMAGWFPDESNLNSRCPYCATNFLPELSITVYEHWEEEDTPPSLIKSEFGCPFLQQIQSTRSSSLLTVEVVNDQHSPSKRLSVANGGEVDGVAQVPLISVGEDSVEESRKVLDGSDEDHSLPLLSVKQSSADDSRTINSVSQSSTDDSRVVDATNQSSQAVEAGDTVSQTDSTTASTSPINTCRLKEGLKVPYLSPLVLRKELETLIANQGAACLTQANFHKAHAIIYWNLLWYCERLTLPQNLTGLLIDETGMKILRQMGHTTSLTSRGRFVIISCQWDDAFLNKEFGNSLPLYLQFEAGNESRLSGNLDVECEAPVISHSMMVQMLARVRDHSDLLTPMKMFLQEMQKRSTGKRHRSLYRELLFLSLTALGNDNVDRLAFDKVYKMAFNALRKDGEVIGILQADDRPPATAATWCRHAFRPLQF